MHVNYTCQLGVRSYAADCVLGPAVLQGRATCVCSDSNVGHYWLSHRVASVGMQCSAGAGTTVCVAVLVACDVTLYAAAAQC